MSDYKISDADYNLLKSVIYSLKKARLPAGQERYLMLGLAALNRAEKLPSENTAENIVMPSVTRPVCRCPEKLTDTKMQQLFGANYDKILYYNCDLDKWNVDNYMGIELHQQGFEKRWARGTKKILESNPKFQDYEMVAIVMMTTSLANFAPVIEGPIAVTCGDDAVGTIICRNVHTGKILPVPKSWVTFLTGIKYEYPYCGMLVAELTEIFSRKIRDNEQVCSALIATYSK